MDIMTNMIFFLIRLLEFILVLKMTMHLMKLLDSYNQFQRMPEVCGHLGHVINVSGKKKGIGKTTTAGGIIISLIIYIQGELMSRMDNIRKSLPEVNFVDVEQNFVDILEYYEYESKMAIDELMQTFDFQTYWTDNLHIYPKEDLMFKYLTYFDILNFRQDYVLSKTYFYDVINKQNSKQLDPSSLELRNVEMRRNYQVKKATVLFDDEKSTGAGNVLSNNKKVKTSGVKDFRALIRNAYEGLNFEVSTKQIDKDEVKLEREQIDSNVNIMNRRIVEQSFALTKFLKVIYHILFFPRKLLYSLMFWKTDELIDKFKKRNNFLRKFESFIFDLENIISSKGYVIIYVRNYFSADDVGKDNKNLYDRVKFVFPKAYCYASVDTYEWRGLADYYEQLDSNAIDEDTSCLDTRTKLRIWKESMNRGIE